jgi:undecaprenyl-diphosphatase
LIAAICTYFYVQLGELVSSHPPSEVDLALRPWTGAWTQAAIVLTTSGLFPALLGVGICALLLGVLVPAWRARAFFAIAMNLAAWKISDALKDVFHRPRPEQWIWHRETSFSYSSGHATDAVVVYGLWALFLWKSGVPQPWRGMLAAALAIWALGVSWSRLALGVHYATDVIGGWLLGAIVLLVGFAVFDPLAGRVRT